LIPYLCNTQAQQAEMLRIIGVNSLSDLFVHIPEDIRPQALPSLPPPLSELELTRALKALGAKNTTTSQILSFLGGGIYDHFVPSIIGHLANRAEFYTAYTPYQPEASQGLLQAFFEYQTMICQITGMEIANASLYDGATALAEAVIMALSVQEKRSGVLIARTVHPEYRHVVATYLKNLAADLTEINYSDGITDIEELKRSLNQNTACVVLQQPNFFGCLEEVNELARETHEAGALLIVVIDPISLGLLKRPDSYGADIAVGEGQSLGLGQVCGGETLGIFACKPEFLRKVPGRLVGMSKDRQGRRGFVLTLQTREQHIRREKATSNICTNHALNALKAAVYLASVGPHGLRHIATLCAKKAAYLRRQIALIMGFSCPFAHPHFKEFIIQTPVRAEKIVRLCREEGILPGIPLGHYYPELEDCLLICVTETKTRAELDRFVSLLKTIAHE
jgi:glycine dehydrogenase subunit 1